MTDLHIPTGPVSRRGGGDTLSGNLDDSGLNRMFQERIAFHTGQTQEQIAADFDRDRWFTAEEAKDYGFIDKVITGATQVPDGAGTLN